MRLPARDSVVSHRRKHSRQHTAQSKQIRIILWLVGGLAVGLLIAGLWLLNRPPQAGN